MVVIDLTSEILAELATWGSYRMAADGFVTKAVEIPQGCAFAGNGHTLMMAAGGSLTLANGAPSLGPSMIENLTIRGNASAASAGLTVESNSFRLRGLTIGDRGTSQGSGNLAYDFETALRICPVDSVNGPATVDDVGCFNYGKFGILIDGGNDIRIMQADCQSRVIGGSMPEAPLLCTAGGLVLSHYHSWGTHRLGDCLLGDRFLLHLTQHECSKSAQLIVAASKGRIRQAAIFLSPDCFTAGDWQDAEGIWIGLDDGQLLALSDSGFHPAGGGYVSNIQIGGNLIGNSHTSAGQLDQTFPSGIVYRISMRAQGVSISDTIPTVANSRPIWCHNASQLYGCSIDVKTTNGQPVPISASMTPP